MRYLQNMYGFQGVANSGLGTLILQPNLRYHTLQVFTTVAGALTDPTTVASNIKLKVGGVTIRDMSPAQCIAIAKTYGYTPKTGEIPIHFSEPWFEDPRIAESFSWDMYGQGVFTLEMTFLNPGGGAVGIENVVAAVDTERNVRPGPNGTKVPFLRILKYKNETFLFSGAQRLGNTTLDKSLPIRRLLITASANDFSDVEVIADSQSVYNQITKAQLSAMYATQGIDNQFFNIPLIFDFDNLGRSRLTANSLEVKLTATGANTATFLNCQENSSFT